MSTWQRPQPYLRASPQLRGLAGSDAESPSAALIVGVESSEFVYLYLDARCGHRQTDRFSVIARSLAEPA